MAFIVTLLCRMPKYSSNGKNVQNIVTKIVLLCSIHQMLSYKLNFALLARFFVKLAYLSMLFILQDLIVLASYFCWQPDGDGLSQSDSYIQTDSTLHPALLCVEL